MVKLNEKINLNFPCNTQNRNSTCYSREVVEKALGSMNTKLPIILDCNSTFTDQNIVVITTSLPYAIKFDKNSQFVNCCIDVELFNIYLEGTVNEENINKGIKEISDFTITSICILDN